MISVHHVWMEEVPQPHLGWKASSCLAKEGTRNQRPVFHTPMNWWRLQLDGHIPLMLGNWSLSIRSPPKRSRSSSHSACWKVSNFLQRLATILLPPRHHWLLFRTFLRPQTPVAWKKSFRSAIGDLWKVNTIMIDSIPLSNFTLLVCLSRQFCSKRVSALTNIRMMLVKLYIH